MGPCSKPFIDTRDGSPLGLGLGGRENNKANKLSIEQQQLNLEANGLQDTYKESTVPAVWM